jgi:hypothetical protein
LLLKRPFSSIIAFCFVSASLALGILSSLGVLRSCKVEVSTLLVEESGQHFDQSNAVVTNVN